MNIYLMSTDKRLYELTKKVISEEHKLIWNNCKPIERKNNMVYDLVVMGIESEEIANGSFENIIKIRGKFGSDIPILVILDGGTIQDIFEILKIGAFDYVYKEKIECEYKRKLENMFQWKWYQTKYKNLS